MWGGHEISKDPEYESSSPKKDQKYYDRLNSGPLIFCVVFLTMIKACCLRGVLPLVIKLLVITKGLMSDYTACFKGFC